MMFALQLQRFSNVIIPLRTCDNRKWNRCGVFNSNNVHTLEWLGWGWVLNNGLLVQIIKFARFNCENSKMLDIHAMNAESSLCRQERPVNSNDACVLWCNVCCTGTRRSVLDCSSVSGILKGNVAPAVPLWDSILQFCINHNLRGAQNWDYNFIH